MHRLRQLPWIALQVAIFGAVMWLAYGTDEGRRQNFGMAPGVLGAVLAFVATALIVVFIEIFNDLRRRWRARQEGRLSAGPVPPGSRGALDRPEPPRPHRLR